MSVRSRLFAGFIAIMLPVLIVILVFVMKIYTIDGITNHLLTVSIPTQTAIGALGAEINDAQDTLYDFLLTNDPQSKINYDYAWGDIQSTTNIIDDFSKTWDDPTLVKLWGDIRPQFQLLQTTQEKIFQMAKSGGTSASISQLIVTDLRPIRQTIINAVDGLRSSSTKLREGGMNNKESGNLQRLSRNLLANISTLEFVGFALLIVSLGLSIIIPLLTSRSIVRPLNIATDIAKRIAAGERNIKISAHSSDEIGELMTALNMMQSAIQSNEENIKANEKKTKTLLDAILKTAEVYSVHSGKLASGDLRTRLDINNEDVLAQLGKDLNAMTDRMASVSNKILESSNNIFKKLDDVKELSNNQSTGVTEQASSIHEITSSLEEIDKSSKQTMQKAKTLGEVAKQTREKGNLGIQSIEKSIQGMKALYDKVQAISLSILDLSAQTQQVGEITAVVNTLAQQSKMLALNASIEAAKAGEAGKGFAVVAIEVKNLAEQSEQSTAQVQKILEDIRHGAEKSVMVTEEGTRRVDESSQLIETTSEIIHSLNNMINDASIASQQIEASIRQETISIEQITAAMSEINQVTTTFVNSVKETESAINYMSNIAKQLKEFISIYKL